MEDRISRPSAADTRLLARIEQAFERHAGDNPRIDAEDLKRALGLRSEYLVGRILRLFDVDGDGRIDREDFVEGVRRVILGSDDEKLLFAFRLHDHDGNGLLDEHELVRMISLALAESDVRAAEGHEPERLARTLLHAADRDRDGALSFQDFASAVKQRPEILRRMTRAEALWIAPTEDLLARREGVAVETHADRMVRWVQNHRVQLLHLLLWGVVNVVLFALGWVRGRSPVGESAAYQLGHATGLCIDFNGALILVPVMRRLLTRLRASRIGGLFPIDDAVDIHRLAGHALLVLAVVHTAAFTASYLHGHAAGTLVTLATSTRFGRTGFLLLAVFGLMWVLALESVRRSRRFELFFYSHLLYLLWFALAFAHSRAFVRWAGIPALAFGVEQILRLIRRGARTRAIFLEPLRSGVTRMDVARPSGFRFEPGDYAFLCIPELARHEWHPFTLSSAPETDVLSFHVRTLGNWTTALRSLAERREADAIDTPLTVYVDGPYGSPSAHLFTARHAVFVGAGIGVTPFASVLESLVVRAASDRASRLEKVHFVWLNRDQYSFEWFTDLLRAVEGRDTRRLIDIHLYMTGGHAGASSMGLEMAREITLAAGGTDVVTGLRARTSFGHPEWNALLAGFAGRGRAADVDVFFCGPPGLGTKVRKAAEALGMRFHEERF